MIYEKPKKLVWWRILAAVALVAVLVAGGALLFRAGFTQGALTGAEGDLALPDFGTYGYHMPIRGFHWFPGKIFFGFLFFFLVIGLFKKIIFGPRWAYRGYGMRGMHPMAWKEGAEKWHAEMHERMDNPKSEPEADQLSEE
jgi:hypothetical protein